MAVDVSKRAAGERAAEFVTDGMVVGLGSGSTARYATLAIAERLRSGDLHDIVAVATSDYTAALARAEGIPLTTLSRCRRIDLTIDGADEVSPELDLIKGLGGCLLREKIVALATRKEIIVVDDSKLVKRLGTRAPVPVEVIRFGWENTREALVETGARCALRVVGNDPFVTDEGNYIIDCRYDGIDDPQGLECLLNSIPGVVENGLFLDIAAVVVVGSVSGVRVITR